MKRDHWFLFVASMAETFRRWASVRAENVTSVVTSESVSTFDLLKLETILSDSFARNGPSNEIALDWLVHIGGVVRHLLESRIRNDLNLSPGETLFRAAMRPDPVLKFETEAVLNQEPEIARRFEWVENGDGSSVQVWRKKFDVETYFASADIDRFLKEMKAADVDPSEPPWVFWRRLAAWSRRNASRQTMLKTSKNMDHVFEYSLVMELLNVALSPQDEKGERESLSADQIMLNPTFETLERADSGAELPLLAIVRMEFQLQTCAISFLEAAVVDHVRESFRARVEDTVQSVAGETRVHPEIARAAIDRLILNGFLLGRVEVRKDADFDS